VDPAEKLQSFIQLQQAQAFRRLLLARLAAMIPTWVIVAWAISLSRAALLVGVATLAVPALWAIAFERRAAKDFFSHQR
jgi:hypothetical protein